MYQVSVLEGSTRFWIPVSDTCSGSLSLTHSKDADHT